MKYTHHNHELNISHLGQTVFLKGWVQRNRNLGGLVFIDLRDRFGITQLVVKPNHPAHETALTLRSEYVIEVKGVVIERESKNLNLPTGEIEIEVEHLKVLNVSETPPIMISNDSDALEETRLKYRYLDLRRPVMQHFLIKRNAITQAVRQSLLTEGFYELETPVLGKSTPEGARDFLVPSRLYPGQFYALPQSPQIYKQLFMIAGFEKYFQFARCFRDEDLRSDRQLEFTQIDIEASFIEPEDIFDLVEKMMVYVFKNVLNVEIATPFMKMTYHDALSRYGSDKPDLRYDLSIFDVKTIMETDKVPLFHQKTCVRGLLLDEAESLTRKVLDQLSLVVKKNHGETLATLKRHANEFSGSIAKYLDESDFERLNLKEGQTLFIVPGNDFEAVSQALGALRVELAQRYALIPENTYKFLWVIDWPLLEYSEEDQRFYAKHHPFTAPVDPEVLKKAPKEAMAKAYDIVVNGYELGGGSIRIHHQDVQKLMFDTLGLSEMDIKERFGFFVDALKYGTPPHGGIALGLDRLVMIMTHTTNIKDVVAFPKTQSAKDAMMQAPSDVSIDQLKELSLEVKKDA